MKKHPLHCQYSFALPLLVLLLILSMCGYAQETGRTAQAASTSSSSATTVIPTAHRIQPAELARILRSSGTRKPLVLQVGSHVLYKEAHIAGSEYAGPGGQAAGLQKLRERVQKLSRNRSIVLYCGCCPWEKCPNIRPAYQELTSMGFTHVKALYLADNFGTDWVEKGYPIAKGH